MLARWFSVLLLLCLALPAWGQDAPPADGEPTEDPLPVLDLSEVSLLGQYSPEVREAADLWAAAWQQVPLLVSLKAPNDAASIQARLEERLKLLGEKIFSNREWKAYWASQSTTSAELTKALRAADAPDSLIGPLERWTLLADDKVTNQNAYFEAIELERDALEDRLEAALEETEIEVASVLAPIDDPNPYEERGMRLDALEQRIATQGEKRAVVTSEIIYIERLLATEKILAAAFQKDLELARTELAISQELADSSGAWGALWTRIAEATATKVRKLSSERDYGQARRRSREVELGLSRSQVAFRDKRIAALQIKLDEEDAVSSLAVATWQTILRWLRSKLWRIVAGLLVVYIGVRLGLRGVNRATTYILAQSDDDPDVDDDGDQRRETLADVFQSVARLSIFIIGSLIALEQIGVNTSPLLGSVAILGLAVSFGAQNLVRDVVNGFFILLENQFAVGDVVSINDKTGTVDRITIRSTWIRSYNGDLHAMANGSISMVSNMTRGWSRTIADISVGYGSDLDTVARVLNSAGQAMFSEAVWKEQLEEAPTFVGVIKLGESTVDVRMHVMVSPGSQWSVQRELYRRMKDALDAADISIPFPQVVVHSAP